MAADFTVRGDTKLDGSGFSEGLSRMGNLAAKGLKVVGASLAAAGVAVGALAKQSLDAYSDYEQMVGGVKTLFGTEADSVEEYAASVGKSVGEVQGEYDALVAAQNKVFADAKNAYKDAGMSANAYMQTVTSFSARLLQGLGGDSQKAAEIANMAVVDINVNKMGSSMTDVQNAYQGFAKQNYTMLDNLKLGYGGTQAEMARLINDSGVLGDTMTVTAETVNNVSFDKIIEAIQKWSLWSGNSPEILLISPILIADGAEDSRFGTYDESSVDRSRAFAAEYRHVAELKGVHFFDAATVAAPGPDCLHMDRDSHKALAEALAAEVRKILG